MNNRIRLIRKHFRLTMEEFGKRLGVTKSAISKMENGSYSVTDQMVLSICREFNVSRSWLLDGVGKMLIDISRDTEIADFVGRTFSSESDTFQKRLLYALSMLDEEQWKILEKIVISCAMETTPQPEEK